MEELTKTSSLVLVDDHPLVLEGIENMLAGIERWKIISRFNNAEDCSDFLRKNADQVHMVITDISLPGMSGIDLCREIKKSYAHVKVMILSMHNSREIVRQAMDAESDGYLLKSTGKNEFLKAVGRILGDSAYYAEELLPILMKDYKAEKVIEEQKAGLSKRELEVLELIVKEHTSEEIAAKLFISKKTVDHHRQHLLEKTGCKSTIGLVKHALANLGMS